MIDKEALKIVEEIRLGPIYNGIFQHFLETAQQAYSFAEFQLTAQSMIAGKFDFEDIEGSVMAGVVAARYFAFRRAISREGKGRKAFGDALDIGAGDAVINLIRKSPLRHIKDHGDPFELGFDAKRVETDLINIVDEYPKKGAN
jgi:hypothetical protein